MATGLAIACSLTAAELPARLAEIRAVSRAALRSKELDGTNAILRFDHTPQVHARLAAIVAAEARCCPFLTMTLGADPDAITLSIEAPADAEPVLRDLVAVFALATEQIP